MKTITEISKPKNTSANQTVGRLFFLEASGGRIHSANADGSDRKVIVSGARVPDGVVVDVEAGHIYWTNMGVPSKNDGSLERAVKLENQEFSEQVRSAEAKEAFTAFIEKRKPNFDAVSEPKARAA